MPEINPDILVVEHLLDLEDATNLQWKITKDIFDHWNTYAKTWCDSKGWLGVFDLLEGDALWFFPPEWGESTKNSRAWFSVISAPEEGEADNFWLTCLTGLGAQHVRLRFGQSSVGQVLWKKTVRERAGEFTSGGFHIDDSAEIFLPLHVDHGRLVQAVREEAYQDLVEPFKKALDQVETSMPLFVAALTAARIAAGKA